MDGRAPRDWLFDVRCSVFDIFLFSPMKTPPFVLGATLLFWGWQTDFLIPGAIMGAIIELSRFVKLRWELSDDDFKRIWTFCALLFLASAVYAFADSGGPAGFGHLIEGPSIATERDAGSASARTAAALIRWLPMIFFLFVFAQVFSARQAIPLHTISLILQRRWKQAKKLGKPLPATRGVDVTYPYFAVSLFAASVHKNQNESFFWGLCVLLAWVLWQRRPRRFGAIVWVGTLMLAIASGYAGARSIGFLQRYVESFNIQMVSRLFGQRGTDPMRSKTQIGEIGRIETSSQIVIRLRPKTGEFPAYLREASYRTYLAGAWSANRAKSDYGTIDATKTNENTWPLAPAKTNELRVGIACFLTDWDKENRYSVGLLPLPPGSVRLEGLPAYILKTNSLGAVLVDGPGLVMFDAIYGAGATFDSPPETNEVRYTNFEFRGRSPGPGGDTNWVGRFGDTNWLARFGTNGDRPRSFRILSYLPGTDLQMPTNEIPALDAVIDELNLRDKSQKEVLETIGDFFETKFTYRLWQDEDNKGEESVTPLSRFLLKTRAGHCEYFATATVLLLRRLGIPARYAVGYSVHETGWSGYVVRQSDAHTWCLVWNDEKKIWQNFDTTPGTGAEVRHNRAGLWVMDSWWWMRFQLSKLRWGQTHLRNYILIGLVPVLALLLFQIVRQRIRRGAGKSATRRSVVWPGLDSEFYQIEKQLTERGLVRRPNETLTDWLKRAAEEPGLADLKDPLRALLRLHYRYRFDPNGLTDEHREELRREARACLERLSRVERAVEA
jgi:transglutaminase-like putative cysteine protease